MDKDSVYLALGSNMGQRKENFETAIKKLEENGVRFIAASPIYQTAAFLLPNLPLDWNRPYLDCVIRVSTDHSPQDLLMVAKKIEKEMGRDFSYVCEPRPIDIDILLYKDQQINTENLTIPHKAIGRYFDQDALSFLGRANIYSPEHQPVFMGILNVTPDSFSDGGIYNQIQNFEKTFNHFVEENVAMIDIGGESTNPKTTLITAEEEQSRLLPVFDFLRTRKYSYFRPKLSIDTYHYETACLAVENGFDIINDVSGLKDERMLELLLKNPHIGYILTHSMSLPPKANAVIKNVDDIEKFFEEKLELLAHRSISTSRIILDVGIGFGKTPYQTIELLNRIHKFQKYGAKILVGHSRKSFMKAFENTTPTLDANTLAISLKIAHKVDIFRVHTPIEHQNVLLAFRTFS
jgi:2-amino-4-hydroxy-6-hydroxymethyldihydropteridine diphosphokinase/dihydropteroate synthase